MPQNIPGTFLLGQIGDKEITDRQLSLEATYPLSYDSPFSTMILTTMAGYLEKDEILVNSKGFYPRVSLEKFLSYVLNDTRAAPRKFTLSVIFSPQSTHVSEVISPQHDYTTILAFSGGVDSTAGLLLALDKGLRVKPVWVGFGQKNEVRELETVQRLTSLLNLVPWYVKIDLGSYVDNGWNRWKSGIIPARNLLFASIAAQMASHSVASQVNIQICAHKEEITLLNTDKSRRFFATASSIFSHAYNRQIIVETPFSNSTKPELVSYWARNWTKKYGIDVQHTSSCYFGTNCGTCKACINRAIAFAWVDVSDLPYVDNPFSDKKAVIRESYIKRFATLERNRKLDILFALHKNESVLPNDLKEFLDKNYKKYQKKIDQRRIQIANAEL